MPERCAFVASASPPRSSCSQQSASLLRSVCQSCPSAIAHPDGSTSPPCYWWVRHPRPARRSTTPRDASESHGMSLRFLAHYTGCPLLIGVPPLGEEGSYTTETSIVSARLHTTNATRRTSGAPVSARVCPIPLRSPP